jgi:MFS family permease
LTPVEFGLTTAAMTGASVVGSFVAQVLVTRHGVRPVAMGGMLLLALGSVLLARGPGLDIVGLLVLGAGLGAAFVGAQIAAVSGTPDRDTGLVSGVADTSFTIGGALGVAVLAAIPGTRGALLVAAGLALVGLAVATTLLKERTPSVRRPPSGVAAEP